MRSAPRFLLLGFGILFVGLAVVIARNLATPNPANPFPALMTIPFLGIGAFLIAWPLRARIALHGTRIEVRGLLQERSADVSEIEGRRTVQSRNGSYTKLYLKQGAGTVNYSNSFALDDDFRAWLQQVPDLDKRDREALLDEISHEQELGATPEERLGKLASAKTWGVFLTIVSIASAAALLFPEAVLRGPAAIVLAATPVAAYVLVQRSPLLYAVFKQKADPRAELSIALVVSGVGLLLSVTGQHFVSVQPLLVLMVPAGLAYFFGFQSVCRQSSQKPGNLLGLLFIAGLYGAGFGMMADTIADRAPATTYSADVLSKHVSRGRSTSYYLELSPWGPMTTPNQVSVPAHTYGSLQAGDEVCLALHPGSVRAPWYQLIECTERFSPDLTH